MSSQENRCFGHAKSRELSSAEIEQVAGGPTYTGIENLEFNDIDGDGFADEMKFQYGDSWP
ncbi:MAG TPA: hypothetical protein VEA15_05375 [Caulobacteraceae bacterium]|nr:hypothetical protein [Caulobacteraceae bacterium]